MRSISSIADGMAGGWIRALLAGVALTLIAGVCIAEPKKSSKDAQRTTKAYAFWPQFPDEPRIQFLRAFSGSGDLTETKASWFEEAVFGKEETDEQGIQKPYGVAAKDGRIYVCDIRKASVTVLDLEKKQTRIIGTTGSNALSHPVDVAIAEDDTLYVADNERGAILVYDARERYNRALGHKGMKPVAIAVHADRLYVCDINNHLVEILNRKTGEKIGTIGSVGDGDGQFRVPLGVDTDAEGNVYVSDMMRCRVQKFTPDGTYVSGVGQLGDYAGSFARPKQLAVDKDKILYVVDAAFQNIQMFDDQHRLLMSFGAAGTFPGAMNLPVGVCVTEEGLDYFKDQMHPGFEAKRLIIVTNQFGPAKVSVYALGTRRESFALQDLADVTIPVSQGVGTTEERMRLAAPADDESGVEGEAPQEGTPPAAAPPLPHLPRPSRRRHQRRPRLPSQPPNPPRPQHRRRRPKARRQRRRGSTALRRCKEAADDACPGPPSPHETLACLDGGRGGRAGAGIGVGVAGVYSDAGELRAAELLLRWGSGPQRGSNGGGNRGVHGRHPQESDVHDPRAVREGSMCGVPCDALPHDA